MAVVKPLRARIAALEADDGLRARVNALDRRLEQLVAERRQIIDTQRREIVALRERVAAPTFH